MNEILILGINLYNLAKDKKKMSCEIKKYPVTHPLLSKYVKFFWEIKVDYMQLNHKLIPQKNINLRFNLSETNQYLVVGEKQNLLEDVYFSGIQDQCRNAHIKHDGKVDMLGICFYPEGFYPFLKVPISEFKNQILGLDEIGQKKFQQIHQKLQEQSNHQMRLEILETSLVEILNKNSHLEDDFYSIFNALNGCLSMVQINEFCKKNNINNRTLERWYQKHIGVSANTYHTLFRFHHSLNHLLYGNFEKFSDLAYDNGYYDQMHFIKDFKRFSGNTPKKFIQMNNSILQIGKFS